MWGIFKNRKDNIVNSYSNKLRDSNYQAGFKAGITEAIEQLRDIQKYNCINLTENEKKEVIQYLIDNNLEFGYHLEGGGFYILKQVIN